MRPSGEKTGCMSDAGFGVIFFASPPDDRHDPDVVVRGPGFAIAPFAIRHERDLFAVGRERDRAVFLLSRRRIKIAGRDVGRPSARHVDDEDVMADVLAPLVPMPIQQSCQPVHLDRVLVRLLALPLVTGIVGDIPDTRRIRTATWEPSPDTTSGAWTPIARVVIFRTLPPVASAMYTCGAPSRDEMNATCLPSWTNRGVFSLVSPPISSLAADDPSAAHSRYRHFACRLLRSVVVRTKSDARAIG